MWLGSVTSFWQAGRLGSCQGELPAVPKQARWCTLTCGAALCSMRAGLRRSCCCGSSSLARLLPGQCAAQLSPGSALGPDVQHVRHLHRRYPSRASCTCCLRRLGSCCSCSCSCICPRTACAPCWSGCWLGAVLSQSPCCCPAGVPACVSQVTVNAGVLASAWCVALSVLAPGDVWSGACAAGLVCLSVDLCLTALCTCCGSGL
jgi:hypothetical protein